MSLRAIIKHYERHGLVRHQEEIGWFRRQPSITYAIRSAGMCNDERGKRYSHQSRLKKTVLRGATRRLLQAQVEIQKCTSFVGLHCLVAATVGDIVGIGELYIYDVTLRIGAYLQVEPECVYLHAGTRRGAGRFVRVGGRKYLHSKELPVEFHGLKPQHVEDILCIYKDKLPGVRNQAPESMAATGSRKISRCG